MSNNPCRIFFLMILQLIQLFLLLQQFVLTSVPISHNQTESENQDNYSYSYSSVSLNTLPSDVLVLILSYHDKFPLLSQVNSHFLNTCTKHKMNLILDRLDGFNPDEEYTKIGSLISLNFKNSVDTEVLRGRIQQFVDRKDEGKRYINIRTRLIAYHALKRYTADTITEFMNIQSFARSVIQIIMIENRIDDFNFLFPYLFSIYLLFPSEYFNILSFVAKNREKLLLTFIESVKPEYFPHLDEHVESDYERIFLYISVLIENSVEEEEFRLTLNSLRDVDIIIFSALKVEAFLLRILPHINTPHRKFLLKILIGYSFYDLPLSSRFKMPMTILFEPEKWPPTGTWPDVFFPQSSGNNEKSTISELSLNLAEIWKLESISNDIFSLMPRRP